MNPIERTPRRRRAVFLGAALGGCLLVAGARSVAGPLEEGLVETARGALEQWVELRKVISKEKRDWAEGRELLEDRGELVQREIEGTRAKVEEARASIGDADEKLAELVEERDRLKQASASLDEVVGSLERRTLELLERSPEPIRERVKPLSQRFPRDPGETKLSLSERFQNVVGVLNELNKFNREVSVSSEVRELASGASAEVTVMYVGLGQGYYVTSAGDAAGLGTSGPDGWRWEAADEAAGEIAEGIAILQGEAPARFVRLPIRIE